MNWQTIVIEPAYTLLEKSLIFVPKVAGMLVILLIGWGIAVLLRKTVRETLLALKIDKLTEKAGLQKFFEKGHFEGTLTDIISGLIYWVTLIIALITAVNAIGITVSVDALEKVVIYVRRLVAAILIMILGVFFSNVMRTVVVTTAANAGIRFSSALGQLTKMGVIAFAVLSALEQLQISVRLIELTVMIIIASLGLAVSIAIGVAFGLGSKEVAGRFLEDWVKKIQQKSAGPPDR